MTPSQKSLFTAPAWISPEAWAGFEEMRKAQKKPLTDRARNCIINTLWRFKEDEGQNVDAVLDQSTVNCWLDVYPVREREARHGKARPKGAFGVLAELREAAGELEFGRGPRKGSIE